MHLRKLETFLLNGESMENASHNNISQSSGKGNIKSAQSGTGESVTRLKETLHEAGSQAGEVARNVMEDIKSAGGEGLSMCTEQGKKQIENLKTYAQSAEEYIKAHPMKSIVVGLAAGAFLSKVFKR